MQTNRTEYIEIEDNFIYYENLIHLYTKFATWS